MPTSETLNNFVEGDLKKLNHKYPFLIRASVIFKIENDPTEKGRICEIEVSAPGPRVFAKSNEDSFEKAVVNTINDLDRQLRKRKEKINKHH